MNVLNEIASRFCIKGTAVSAERYGMGHINDTYLVKTDADARYIMQRINHNVFKDVPSLMENIVGVTEYIASAVKGTEAQENCLRVIRTAESGAGFIECCGNFYRMYNFIEDGISIESKPSLRQFELSGIGFGRFQKLLDGYPAEKLHETITDFHNTLWRYGNFMAAVEKDRVGRAAHVAAEIEFYKSRLGYCGVVLDKIKSGDIPLRVTHNDTKLNNVLIDTEADRVSAVIDLDTVMPGSILYDFGDSIRFGASTAAEDEKDLDKVNFSLTHFEAYAKGFIGEVGERLTEAEIELMPFGAILMTYECGMRFLTDHLDGDNYFRIHREGHNLDRARTQMKLVLDMEGSLPTMKSIVRGCI